MNKREQTGNGWLISLCVIATLSGLPLQSLHATDAEVTDETDGAAAVAASPGGDNTVDTQTAWEHFVPPPDSESDWIQLSSGEWLKGKIKTLYDGKLEFKSSDLGSLSLSWDTVKQVRTANSQTVRFEDPLNGDEPMIVSGMLVVDGDRITVSTGNGARTINKEDVISIAKTAQTERDLWSGKVFIGANIRSGNTDVTDVNMIARAARRAPSSRSVTDYIGFYSQADGAETSNNHRLGSYYDRFQTKDLYWRVIFAEYFQDTFRNINDQVTLSTGIGYTLIKNNKTNWDVSAGVGALYKRYVSVAPSQELANTSPSLDLATEYSASVTDWMDLFFSYNAKIVDKEAGTYLHHLLTTASSKVTGNLNLEVSFVWDYVQDPQGSSTGIVPEKNDTRVILGVAYGF